MARMISNEKGVVKNIDLPLHDCSEKDLNEFYPLRDKDKEIFNDLSAGENSSFKCLDWNDSLSIKSGNFQTIDFILVECSEWTLW